jgi:peptidoglycan/xylan/chitin deacetylase (PgdA/CDA1 family)
MASSGSFGGKRELLARGLHWSGVSLLLKHLPARDSLLVLNYHRIGNPEEDLFDPNLFSTTAGQFDEQISYMKRNHWLITLEEALAFVDGTIKEKVRRSRVLITFDDGFLDNYEVAFPILNSHGVQGVFFLCTSLVGSCHVPWWDHIAYLVKTAQRRRFSLRYPSELAVDIDRNGSRESLRAILREYKKPENTDHTRFIQELAEEAQGEDPPGTLRRFLSWDEARTMVRGGMAIGSHTHSHPVLSQLEPERQFEELSQSRAILKQQIGLEADSLAYPVGATTSFSALTQQLAQEAGYRAAFSYYGGVNQQGTMRRYDLKRAHVGYQSWTRFRVQASVCRFAGRYWP